MKRLLFVAALLLPIAGRAVSIIDVQSEAKVRVELKTDGRSQITAFIKNDGTAPISLEIPAGLVAVGRSGTRVAAIRPASITIPSGQSAEAIVPVVPLSFKNGATEEMASLSRDSVEQLKPLLDWSLQKNDLPRATSQLAALLLLENVTFTQWQEFLRRETASEARPSAADIAAAIDAVVFARGVVRDGKLAISEDPEFRLRALRNPWSRAKAMQLFGMNPPEGVPIPDLNQLLHTRPGDNCPICRLRDGNDPSNGL